MCVMFHVYVLRITALTCRPVNSYGSLRNNAKWKKKFENQRTNYNNDGLFRVVQTTSRQHRTNAKNNLKYHWLSKASRQNREYIFSQHKLNNGIRIPETLNQQLISERKLSRKGERPCRLFFLNLAFLGKGKTGLAKIIAHLTNSNPFKKRFFNQPITFPGSNLDSGEIKGNVIGSACSKDLTAWARGLSPTSTTRSDKRFSPLASEKTSGIQGRKIEKHWEESKIYSPSGNINIGFLRASSTCSLNLK